MANIYDKSSLVLIPSGTKTSKIFSQKPTNGDGDFTFTRSSAATRVNADGNIEKETGNLFLQSNNFNTTWTSGTTNASVTSGQTNPNGGSTAWLVTELNDGGSIRQSVSIAGVLTFSMYLKYNSGTPARASLFCTDNNNTATFDLSAGSVTSENNIIDSSIQDVGGSWYRCSITFNASSASTMILFPNNGSGIGSCFAWNAQLEQGLVARDYIETTSPVYGGITDNVPRLDYTDSSCPALLLEPLRTNLVTQSEYFGAWNTSTGAITITSNYGVSPEGLQNSSRVQFTSASQHINISTSLGTGVTSTGSVYIKGTAGETIQFDTGGAGALKTLTGDWQRIEVTSTSVSSLFLINTFGGATARDIEVWGAQCEAASYATSYIPTYGSSVTRNVDSGYNSSAASVIGQGEGTIYIETIPLDDLTSYTERLIQFESAGSDFITFQRYANGNITFYGTDGTNTWTIQALNVFSGGTTTKIAGAYKVNDVVLYVNGQSKGTDTSIPTMPNCDRVWFANNISGGFLYIGKHTKVMFFPTRLSNEELAALTTI